MKTIFCVFLYFVSCIDVCASEIDIKDFVLSFHKFNHFKELLVMSCNSVQNSKALLKHIAVNDIRFNVIILDELTLFKNFSQIFATDHKLGIIFDTNCPNSYTFMKYAVSKKFSMFNEKNIWIIFGNDVGIFFHELNILDLNINSNVIYVVPYNAKLYKIYDVYNTGKRNFGKLVISEVGFWGSTNKNFSKALKIYKYARRSNLTGVILKCMIVVTKKLQNSFIRYISTPTETHIDSMNRFNFALLSYLKDMFHIRYYIMRTNSWGYLRNGTFNGMVGQLEKKLIDIGGSPIFFRLERAKVVDYTIQTWTSRPCFIFRHPKQTLSLFKTYIQPLGNSVWYYTISVVLTIIFLIYLFKKIRTSNNENSDENNLSTVGLFTLGVIFQQGTDGNFFTLSGRILLITLSLFSLLIYQFYSASIVSSLLMDVSKTIKTLEDLLKSNLNVGLENILYTIDYFSRTNDPVAIELYKKRITPKNNLFNPVDGLKLVKKGGFAFHVDIATGYKIIRETFTEKEICDLTEIQLFPPQRMMTVVQKGSPYRKLITYGLRKVAEVGLMAKQRSIWHEKKPTCIHSSNSEQFNVTIYDVSSALIFLFCGMVISTVMLILEIIVNQLKK